MSCWRYTTSCLLTNSFTGFSLIGLLDLDLDLDSELNLDMDLNLDSPSCPSNVVSVSVAKPSHSAHSARMTQHKALDTSLLLFFPRKGHVRNCQVRTHRRRGGNPCTLECSVWREWKRWHRESGKSQQRRVVSRLNECWPLSSVRTLFDMFH